MVAHPQFSRLTPDIGHTPWSVLGEILAGSRGIIYGASDQTRVNCARQGSYSQYY